ncbi:P-loop containing nucleoside triphosphate hydrolase protein [Chytridium lagenaria]|nr:P-loop containing nucleoside triphosphate hydrolase protein [Chytridium lagenaria]
MGGDAAWPVEDMTTLSELTENAILTNLQARYTSRQIYTYTGSILVALNPYESLDIYGTSTIKQYTGKRLPENSPHIFALAEQALQNIRTQRENQSVIISGESGAGKSESTKSILAYWTAATSSTQTSSHSPVSPNQGGESWIQQQVLEANTVLESFGNAKTVRNNNSSRFGKFIQVHLDHKVQIIGASVVSYLLEKSRIAKQSPTERNYHVFYEFLAGTNDDEKGRYKLNSPSEFHYLSQSGCIEIQGVNDKKQFEGLKLAMMVLNMGSSEMDGIFRGMSKESVRVSNPEVVETVAELLGVDRSKLTDTLCFRRLSVRNEVTMVPLKGAQGVENRDSIAKSLYDNLFQRILEFINTSLMPKTAPKNFAGVLDIFGFEVFEVNSFEQFCINYTNEKLQQFFNQFIFKLEQEEYTKENISWESIKFVDNQLCLDLIEMKPIGILSLLDEETKVPKGSDESWVGKLFQQYEKNQFFIRPKTSKIQFGVRHYAGDVTYTSTGFLEKNKDAIQDELIELVQKRLNQMLMRKAQKVLLDQSRPPAHIFKNQLINLVSTLGATTPHYVRCIKPNSVKQSFGFDDNMVLAQLRYSGMLDTIKIRKAGYPMRIPFAKFANDYKCLIGLASCKSVDPRDRAAAIISNVDLKAGMWQLGKTKVFLRKEAYSVVRGWYARDYYRGLKQKAWEAEHEKRMLEQAALKGKGGPGSPSVQSPMERVAVEALQEAETLKMMAAAVQKQKEAAKDADVVSSPQVESNANPVDDLFSFLGDFSAANDLAKLAANLTSEIDSMLASTPLTVENKEPALEEEAEILEINTTRENLPGSAHESQELYSASSPSRARGLKANPLIKKEGSSESLSGGKINPHSPEWSMTAFAEKNFELHEKKKQKSLLLLGKKATKGGLQGVDEMLRHTKYNSASSRENLQTYAVECFKNVQKAMDPSKKADECVQAIQATITYGLEHPELRDEILVQIIKQMTPPTGNDQQKGWDTIALQGWQLLALCSGTFPPSKTFSKYFLAFIQRGISSFTDSHIYCKLAKICEESFKNSTLNGPRKLPPSIAEINAIKNGARTIPCRFHLLNGVSEELPISSVTTAADIVKELSMRVNLRDPAGWTLYEASWKSEHAIKSNEYIADIISSLEKETRKVPQPNSSVFKSALKFKKRRSDPQGSALATGIFSHEIQLVMKKRVFRNPKETILDPVEHSLLYCQAVDNVNHDSYVIGIRDAIKLAALRAQVLLGDCDMASALPRFSQNINEWVVERLAASVPRTP